MPLMEKKISNFGTSKLTSKRYINSSLVVACVGAGFLGFLMLFCSGKKIIWTLLAMTFCILSFQGLSSLRSSRKGIVFGILSFICAAFIFYRPDIGCSFKTLWIKSWWFYPISLGGLVGLCIAWATKMIYLPQLMAFFHSLVGLATSLLTLSLLIMYGRFPQNIYTHTFVELSLGGIMAAITFTGSVIAGLKIQGWIKYKKLALDKWILSGTGIGVLALLGIFVFWPSLWILSSLLIVSGMFGALIVLSVGGADMPVVISLLNSCSGWAALGIGFSLNHPLFIVVGAIVGFSGAILSYTMCKGMNRSLINVLWKPEETAAAAISTKPVKSLSWEDAAFILTAAQSIIVVPGYGLAAARAQYALCELMGELKDKGAIVRYAIHPVAGRMPGHMNVLLAEANISYEDTYEFDEIQAEFSNTDVVIVIGANDIVNPLANTDPASSIYGMPIFNVGKAKTVFFVKRSMAPGYAGLDNPLFYEQNTFMIFGDAKKVCEDIMKNL